MTSRLRCLGVTLLLFVGATGPDEAPKRPWGARGHRLAARAAVAVLPSDIPGFFRDAGEQLAYLNPEPDRWREQTRVAMDQAWSYDHYIDLENVPDAALDSPDRFSFLRALGDAGLARPQRDGGLLPYRILELYQRLVLEWELWRREDDSRRREWIEARIVNDAGILGHYVTDASQPHHTTIHFNGWSSTAPNPRGYSTDRSFHSRFEVGFVDAHVTQADVDRRVGGARRSVAGSARAAVLEHIRSANARVEELYRLEQVYGFRSEGPTRAETRDFAAERLAEGARMLAILWWSAWRESGG